MEVSGGIKRLKEEKAAEEWCTRLDDYYSHFEACLRL